MKTSIIVDTTDYLYTIFQNKKSNNTKYTEKNSTA